MTQDESVRDLALWKFLSSEKGWIRVGGVQDENENGEIVFENGLSLIVSAVIENPRRQSHFEYDLLASFTSLKPLFGGNIPSSWVWNPCWTYITLKEGVDPNVMNEKLPAFVNDNFGNANKENNSLDLQALTTIHLNSELDYEIRPNGHMGSLYVLGLIAIFVLFIAIINFTNLSTAGAAGRAREIGVKKVYGASRKQLIIQISQIFQYQLWSRIAGN